MPLHFIRLFGQQAVSRRLLLFQSHSLHNTQQDCSLFSFLKNPQTCFSPLLFALSFLPLSLHTFKRRATHASQFVPHPLAFFHCLHHQKHAPVPCAYCRGRLPLLPVVATLRLPPSLNSRSSRAHNFAITPSSYVICSFFPMLAQGCFPFFKLRNFNELV